MRVVVTGAAGFLGRAMVVGLLQHRPDVDIVAIDVIPTASESDRVTSVVGDICDKIFLMKSLLGAEIVFHVAGLVKFIGDDDLVHKVNYHGTKTLLEVAKECGVRRFIYSSSANVGYTGNFRLHITCELTFCREILQRHQRDRPLTGHERVHRCVLAVKAAGGGGGAGSE